MQIPMQNRRRVDFYGNSKDGVYIEITDDTGLTIDSRLLTEEERMDLIYQLTRRDNGRAV